MVERHLHDGIPNANLAADFQVSCPNVTIWVARNRGGGAPGLHDRPSRPYTATGQLDLQLVARIEELRREQKWSARRINYHLRAEDHQLPLPTVDRWLHRLQISRLKELIPAGEQLRRAPQWIRTKRPGQMVHLDVKELGRIPDSGGWWAHGRGTEAARVSKSQRRGGYTYLHSAIDGQTRLAYIEALRGERPAISIGFFHRARVFLAGQGVTEVERVVTDNRNNCRAVDFSRAVQALSGRHPRIHPYTTRHDGRSSAITG